jgi:hypothetical protein
MVPEVEFMAGYSGTPLPKKLGIAPACRLALVSAPAGFLETLGPLPDDVTIDQESSGSADVIVAFFIEAAELKSRFKALARRLAAKGGLWIAWPKKASGVATDVTENLIREIGLPTGLVDNKVCAIDEIWSGLRFVHRKVPRQDGKVR